MEAQIEFKGLFKLATALCWDYNEVVQKIFIFVVGALKYLYKRLWQEYYLQQL